MITGEAVIVLGLDSRGTLQPKPHLAETDNARP